MKRPWRVRSSRGARRATCPCSSTGRAPALQAGGRGFDTLLGYGDRGVQVVHAGLWLRKARVRVPAATPRASWAAGRPAVCKTAVSGHAWFKSRDAHHAPVAQWREHQLPELGVAGSNPAGGTWSHARVVRGSSAKRDTPVRIRLGLPTDRQQCHPLWTFVGGPGRPTASHKGGAPGSTPGPTTCDRNRIAHKGHCVYRSQRTARCEDDPYFTSSNLVGPTLGPLGSGHPVRVVTLDLGRRNNYRSSTFPVRSPRLLLSAREPRRRHLDLGRAQLQTRGARCVGIGYFDYGSSGCRFESCPPHLGAVAQR